MLTCTICKSQDPGGSQKTHVACDKCKTIICHACTELTSTELRVLGLAKRSLKYFCDSCNVSGKIITEPATSNNDDNLPNLTENEFLKQQIGLMESTIKDKDTIIQDKSYIIQVLEDKFELLEEKYSKSKKENDEPLTDLPKLTEPKLQFNQVVRNDPRRTKIPTTHVENKKNLIPLEYEPTKS